MFKFIYYNPPCVCMLSGFSHVLFFATLWIVAHQAPLSIRFSRQEYWSGLPCPPPEYLPSPGIKPKSSVAPSLQLDSLLLSHWGSPQPSTLTVKSYAELFSKVQKRYTILTLLKTVEHI